MTEREGRLMARPQITLKLATSLDGKIATTSGASKWITGQDSRARVRKMRAEFDCILTGVGTVLADDPELTARTDPPPLRQPVRAVLDSQARTPMQAKLFADPPLGPVCFFHDHVYSGPNTRANHHCVARSDTGLDIAEVLATLSQHYDVKTLMVEAGGTLAGAVLRGGYVDKITWFRAPIIIGGDGMSVFASLGVDALADAYSFDCISIEKVGRDHLETYVRTKEG
jgi:diaminohydroxyphosphoribosylaminopyrimidine deaminase / 5-amino-6-(5-phosphoribosylamino)uracil reductase